MICFKFTFLYSETHMRIISSTWLHMEIVPLTMNWLAIQRLNLELARGQRLEKLAQGILSWHRIPVPHQGRLVQVEPGQVLWHRSRSVVVVKNSSSNNDINQKTVVCWTGRVGISRHLKNRFKYDSGATIMMHLDFISVWHSLHTARLLSSLLSIISVEAKGVSWSATFFVCAPRKLSTCATCCYSVFGLSHSIYLMLFKNLIIEYWTFFNWFRIVHIQIMMHLTIVFISPPLLNSPTYAGFLSPKIKLSLLPGKQTI